MQLRSKSKPKLLQDEIEIHTPFIEHLSIKTLRRVLKYSFRSIGIMSILVFSFITWYSIYILLRLGHGYWNSQPFSLGFFEIYFALEAVFLTFMNLKYSIFKKLVDSSNHLPQVTEKDFKELKKEFMEIKDICEWLEGWFLKTPYNQISRQDFEEWCACYLFNTRVYELEKGQLAMVNELVDAIEKKLPSPFPQRGADEEGCPKLLLTLDSPKIYHRPMIVYLGINVIHNVCRGILMILGYTHVKNSAQGLPFYFRTGKSKEPAIVFFHGLGIGMSTYVLICAGMAFKYPDRNIVLFEMPSISMKLNENHILPEEFSNHVASTLESLGLNSAIFAGHSLGTCCVSWMLKFHPKLVKATLFIDPVCFKLWYHHIAYNALYRKPKTFHEAFINIVAMTEPGHSIFLHRYFVWWQNCILTKDLPTKCMIFMSEKDNIVDVDQVVKYLVDNSDPGRKLVLYKGFRHGQILASPEFTRVVTAFKELDQMISES